MAHTAWRRERRDARGEPQQVESAARASEIWRRVYYGCCEYVYGSRTRSTEHNVTIVTLSPRCLQRKLWPFRSKAQLDKTELNLLDPRALRALTAQAVAFPFQGAT